MVTEDIVDVSVVITVYNIERYISECLDSILSQKEKNIEVICVDDASTDGSLGILKKYEERDERVIVISHQKNKGSGSARNTGCRAAKGKYLYVIDGDDMSVEGAIARLYDIAVDNQLEILTFEGEAFWEDDLKWTGDKAQIYRRKGNYDGIYTGAMLFGEFIKNHDTTGNTYMNFIDREFFVNNNLYWTEGIRYNSDSVFAIYMAARRVMCISDILYRRRYRVGSVVTTSVRGNYLPGMTVQFMYELNLWDAYGSISEETDKWIETYFKMMYADINRVYQLTQNEQFAEEDQLLETNKRAQFFYKYCVRKQPLFMECIAEEDMEKVKAAERIVIYGAGRYGILAAEVLEYYGIVDYEVAVTNINGTEAIFRGKKIRNIADLKAQEDNTIVIIAVGSKLQEEMADTLKKIGLQKYIFCKQL